MASIRTVGYRQAWQYLAGEISYELMREKAIAATRQLAKRQITWLRRWDSADYYSMAEPRRLEQLLKKIQ
jgi:tRNA dimethylallyltransferase